MSDTYNRAYDVTVTGAMIGMVVFGVGACVIPMIVRPCDEFAGFLTFSNCDIRWFNAILAGMIAAPFGAVVGCFVALTRRRQPYAAATAVALLAFIGAIAMVGFVLGDQAGAVIGPNLLILFGVLPIAARRISTPSLSGPS